MGWYGDYNTIECALDSWLRNFSKDDCKYILLDKKVTRNTAALLFQEKETGKINADLMIFRDKMYKPLSWIDRPNFIPSKWKTQLKPFMSEYEKESLQRDKEIIEERKNKKQALARTLELGAVYRITSKYNDDVDYLATYKYKNKRSHIFQIHGESNYTRFNGLGENDYWTLEKVESEVA